LSNVFDKLKPIKPAQPVTRTFFVIYIMLTKKKSIKQKK